jgi:hypothetical protein|tara:strand:+ start:739 stop:918 length:180 start_codon:yes stop_codon:yes gene_type:complete
MKSKTMTKDLVKVSTFAKLTGRRTQDIYNMIKPQEIEAEYQDGSPFIDLNKYNPEDFKK